MTDLCEVCGESADPEEGHALCVLTLAKECDRLRAALRQYGDHTPDCTKIIGSRRPCTCGFAAALEGAQEAKK